jgi:hypothetical protein
MEYPGSSKNIAATAINLKYTGIRQYNDRAFENIFTGDSSHSSIKIFYYKNINFSKLNCTEFIK